MSEQDRPVTASHRPYSGPDVQILTSVPRAHRRAQKRLLALRGELGSWSAVARKVGPDKGLLRRVALGKQKAPAAILRALYPPPAPRPDYATWKAAHLPLLERMVAWAETPKERRGEWKR